MKKFLSAVICIISVLALCFVATGNYSLTAYAETITGAKLEYFELNKPLCVCKDGETVYIAEKELVVIYHNDTYNKVPLEGFDIKNIAKCGNHLLILSNNSLYSLNLATLELAKLALEQNPALTFDNVASFAVCNSYFAINTLQREVYIFNVTDGENFLFEIVRSSNSVGDLKLDSTVETSYQLALTPNLSLYYFNQSQNSLHFMDTTVGMQGPYTKFYPLNVDCFAFDNDTFYYKSNNVIYSVEKNLQSSMPEVIVDLNSLGIENSGDFYIKDNLILVCNVNGDAVVEYDLTTEQLTGFEISFTKINMPQDFEIQLNVNPTFITVPSGVKLYDIHLANSKERGYFVFNGYHTQEQTAEYLVVSEISNAYYLIAGDVVALVLKEDFTPTLIPQAKVDAPMFVTTDANTYLQPRLNKEFLSFKVNKFDLVTCVSNFTLAGVNYSIIKYNDNFGFLPSSFLVKSLYDAPQFLNFETANITNKSANVYSNAELASKTAELPAYSQIIIIEKLENCYRIIYGENQSGYVSASSVQKRGWFTNKIVAVVIILAVAVLFTALFLEIKYLYTKKKEILSKNK